MKHMLWGLAFVAVACSTTNQNSDKGKIKEVKDDGSSVNFGYMNTSVKPQDDFYEFANGQWVKDNPIPASETRISSFNELEERNNESLRKILEEAAATQHEKGSIEQLIGDFYFSYMDTLTRDELGMSPLETYLEEITSMESTDGIELILANLHNVGIPVLFGAEVEQDLKNNTRHRLYLGQNGLGLPGKGYYTKTDEDSKDIQQDYVSHVTTMLSMTDMGASAQENLAQLVYEMELQLAEASMSMVELRNYFAQYNPTSTEDLKKLCPAINWPAYFKARNIEGVDTLIVAQPDFFAQVNELVSGGDVQAWKAYLTWHVVHAAAPFLTRRIEKENFNFYGGRLGGQKSMRARWKNAISTISGMAIDEALGHAFVNKHFSVESKEKVNAMVDNIMAVFEERIKNLEWMSKDTKDKALEKLASFTRKFGYPDKWKDYSALDLDRFSLASNVIKCQKFEIAENIARLNKPIDKSRWGMAPHIVNAYYNPLFNEIVFPAGIMQPPFFDPSKEDAYNYATMGAVIGHELTHGFDDQGALFTAAGEFKNWWGESDQLQFATRTKKLESQFSKYEALPGLKINGKLTLGENIADFGGLTIAYYAYQKSLEGKQITKMEGFTNNQRFFLAFAQIWKSNYTEGAMKIQVNTNPHSPGKWRVLGPLSNMPEFFDAFDVKDGDAMRQSEENIAVIW